MFAHALALQLSVLHASLVLEACTLRLRWAFVVLCRRMKETVIATPCTRNTFECSRLHPQRSCPLGAQRTIPCNTCTVPSTPEISQTWGRRLYLTPHPPPSSIHVSHFYRASDTASIRSLPFVEFLVYSRRRCAFLTYLLTCILFRSRRVYTSLSVAVVFSSLRLS